MAVKHAFTSPKADDPDATLVRPSNWNADHTIDDGTITEAKLSLSDNTTKDVSTSQHGLAPKAPNDATKYLDGTGNYSVPSSNATPGLDYQSIDGSLTSQPWESIIIPPSGGHIVTEVGGGNAMQLFSTGLFGPTFSHDDSGFAWVNQGLSTIDTSLGGVYLSIPASATTSVRTRKKTAPGTPWTFTVFFMPGPNYINNNSTGLIWRESGSSKLVLFAFGSSSGALSFFVNKYTNDTTFSANYLTSSTVSQYVLGKGGLWMRIQDDGVNRLSQFSNDGVHWFTFHSIGRTDFLTADEYGYAADAGTGTQGIAMWITSSKLS